MSFVFNQDDHTYWLDGRELTNVSRLIAPLGDGIPEELEDIFAIAAERGTTLHRAISSAVEGLDLSDELPDDYLPFWGAASLFLAENSIEPIAIEEPIYSEQLGIAGTPDLLCKFNGSLAILDYKFVSSVDKLKAKAQLNLYAMMYREQGIFPEELYIVQFTRTGYRVYPVAEGTEETTICLTIKALKEKKHRRGRID